MPAPNDQAPLTDAEADGCLGPILAEHAGVLLAVSGGVDSMVLMHLAADVRQRHALPVRLLVGTVDHGLRPESATEAAFVATTSRHLGIDHVTSMWSGPKPSTGLPAAARTARYDLLVRAAREQGADVILTAHTRDDQAETVLMRLARGSGVDGLSGMSPTTTLPASQGAVNLLRPLLDIPKSRLIATAKTRNIAWREDPSNVRTEFERPRIRKALALLEDLGVSSAAIARSARRLQTARHALTSDTVRFLADPARLHLDPLGFATLDRPTWRETPIEIRIRVLAAVIRHVGGIADFLSRARLEDIERGLFRDAFTITYARTKISATALNVRIQRESGRSPAISPIDAGQTIVWDHRFRVMRFAGRPGAFDPVPLTVRQLGPVGLKFLRDQGLAPEGIRADILHTVPGFWSGTTLVSVPPLAALGDNEPVSREGGMWFSSRAELIAQVGRRHTSD
jgi:tRNA(Ile)-lysidine synthase